MDRKSINYFYVFFNYLRFFRIQDWFYIVGLAYLGFFFKNKQLDTQGFFILTIISSLYLAHGYSINNYFDYKRNAINQPKQHQLYREYDLRIALFISVLFFLINLFIAFLYSKAIFSLVVLGGAVSFLYSFTQTRFKKYFLSNIIFNSTGFAILFLIGYLFNKPPSGYALFMFVYIWLAVIPSQIIHLMAHKHYDRDFAFLPLRTFKPFYFSLLLWAIWTILSFLFTDVGAICLPTLFFCLSQVLIIRLVTHGSWISGDKVMKTRVILRFLNVIFGLILLYYLI